MFTLHTAMSISLGVLLALLMLVLFMPAYRRRIERFATEALKQSLPLTEAEIRADKDRLRAEFAMDVHRLESRLEEARLAAARQSVEINRRDAKIQDLNDAMSAQKTTVEEHENARRVLEQAILDRLPKVEKRLSDTRRLLEARDREIIQLTESSAKQASALEEATQVNRQQADEVYRLKAALDTRAARNRETIGDPRFDGEVALRTEIEMLRAKSREQSSLIERLQASEKAAAKTGLRDGGAALETEIENLKSEVGRLEAAQRVARSGDDVSDGLKAQLREAEARLQDRAGEIIKLKAAISAYEGGAAADIADKAEIHALRAQATEQSRLIEALRSEVAAGAERLARQTQHFRDELRRLGSPEASDGQAGTESPRLSLAERINAPKVPSRQADEGSSPQVATAQREPRPASFLRTVNGGDVVAAEAEAPADQAAAKAGKDGSPRRSRLLERISQIDKG